MAMTPDRAATENRFQFKVDRQLGKLLKWLRLLGFDAIPEKRSSNQTPSQKDFQDSDRIWIIPSQAHSHSTHAVIVTGNDPICQLKEVIDQLSIQRHELNPLIRCIRCNQRLKLLSKDQARGRVPDYIWETHGAFRQCPVCQKIYWRGSHVDNQKKRIDQLFKKGTMDAQK